MTPASIIPLLSIDDSVKIIHISLIQSCRALLWRDNPENPRDACIVGGFRFYGAMKSALLIDGGYLRANAGRAGKTYDNTFIEAFAKSCFAAGEYTFRIFYYDCPQFRGERVLPVSGAKTKFSSSDQWLNNLAKLERFAVRRGTLGFRGWKPKTIPVASNPLTDADFAPIFEQKGVDMRIGLDIATFSERRSIDQIILVSGDTDMIPAMKQARKSGLEVSLVQLSPPAQKLHDTLLYHSDTVRPIGLP